MHAMALFFLTQYPSIHYFQFYTCLSNMLLIFNTFSKFSEFFFSKFPNGKEGVAIYSGLYGNLMEHRKGRDDFWMMRE
jgi:hypothetical protein